MPQDKAGRTVESHPTSSLPKGINYVLVIGIDAYVHCPRLYNCVKDAHDLIELLTERYHFERNNFKEIFNAEATRGNIYNAFRDMAQRVTPNDNLLIYFSGHGEYDPVLKRGFWIPVEAQPSDHYQYISNSDIKDFLSAINSHHTFLMSDSCFAGALFAKGVAKNITKRYENDPSRWGLTAGRNEIVSDGKPGDNSPFAESLLYRLRQNTDALGVAELCAHVVEQVQAKTTQTPIGEPLKVEGHKNGQFVFHLKQDEVRDWVATETADKATIYLEFWQKYPKSPQAEEALWRYLSKVQKLEAYNLYKKEYPQGKYILDAIEKLDSAYFAEAKTLNDFKLYLQVFGEEANHAYEAHRRIDEFLLPIIMKNLSNQEPKLETPRLSFEPEMVFVQGGTFKMGSNEYDSEKPIHEVTVKDFYIGKYPVTQAEWQAVMGSDPPELYFKGCDQCPVEKVSWNDVQEFLKKLNEKTDKQYRLPTEAEWEYAARGGKQSKAYKYAGSNNLNEVAWYHENSSSKTHPVGEKKANELGIHDMSGNVWEWCADIWHDNYEGAPTDGSTWLLGGNQARRVVRGGSWIITVDLCRVSDRCEIRSDNRDAFIGFRLAGY